MLVTEKENTKELRRKIRRLTGTFKKNIGKRRVTHIQMHSVKRVMERCNRLLAMIEFTKEYKSSVFRPFIWMGRPLKFPFSLICEDWATFGVFIDSRDTMIYAGTLKRLAPKIAGRLGKYTMRDNAYRTKSKTYANWCDIRPAFGNYNNRPIV